MKKLYLLFAFLFALIGYQDAGAHLVFHDNGTATYGDAVSVNEWGSSTSKHAMSKVASNSDLLHVATVNTSNSNIQFFQTGTSEGGNYTQAKSITSGALYKSGGWKGNGQNRDCEVTTDYGFKVIIGGTATTLKYDGANNKYSNTVTISGSPTFKLEDTKGWFKFKGNNAISASNLSTTLAYDLNNTSSISGLSGEYTVTFTPLNGMVTFEKSDGDETITSIKLWGGKSGAPLHSSGAAFNKTESGEWILNRTEVWTDDTNPYYLEVVTDKATYRYVPKGTSDAKYYITAKSTYDVESTASATNAFVFVSGFNATSVSGKVTIGPNGLPATMTFYEGNGVSDQPVVRPDAPDTVKWSVTGASDANPRYFLVGDRLNNWRVTPEAELVKQADGTYRLNGFVMVPDGSFQIRKFTGKNSYSNLSAQDGDFWVNTTQLTGSAADNSRKFTHDLLRGNGTMQWKLGYTMVNMQLDSNGSNITIELDYSYPSTLKEAPIHGLPYVALVGDAQGQVDQLGTPNTYGTSDLTGNNSGTNGGWQEGWVQYTADGKIYTYESGLNSSAYGGGCNEGNAMYSTLVPPRTPISFYGVKNAAGFESGSPKNTFTYVGTMQRKNSLTTNNEAKNDDNWYAVYEINNVRFNGRYKLWSGWGGNVLGNPSRANWSNNPNFGFGEWSDNNANPIEVEKWYNMKGSQKLPSNGDTSGSTRDDQGGNYNFAEEHYFAKVRFWYKLTATADKSAYNGELAAEGSYVIHLLAHGAPYAKIDRAGKTSLSCEYSVQNPESDSRTVSSWGVDLYKGGKLYRKNVATSDETDPKKIGGTVVVDDLPSGLYHFVMHMRYDENSAGDVVIVQPEDAVTATRRIYGAIAPVITRAEQVTDTEWPAENVSSSSATVEMVVPSVELANVLAQLKEVPADADMTHIATAERMNVRHGHVREHDTEGSDWQSGDKSGKQGNGGYGAHLTRYNRIDADGELTRLNVTDGVLNDWTVNIEIVLQDAGSGLDEKYTYAPDATSGVNKSGGRVDISYLPIAIADATFVRISNPGSEPAALKAVAKNGRASNRALLAIEAPSYVSKDFGGATTDLDEVLGEYNTVFRVYPNPAVDVVTVEAAAEIGDVEVVASSGATALKAEIRDTKGQLDVSTLPSGLYLLPSQAGTTRLIIK